MSQKVFKTGNSLAVTIPASFARIVGLRSGMMVGMKVDISRLTITYRFSGSGQLPLLKVTTRGRKRR